jgi:transcription termination factor Rho
VSDNLTVERVDLQKKDKSELQTIVIALGGKPTSRATKADLIDAVLQLSGAVTAADSASAATDAPADTSPSDVPASVASNAVAAEVQPDTAASASVEGAGERGAATSSKRAPAKSGGAPAGADRGNRSGRRGKRNAEPPAEWETDVDQQQQTGRTQRSEKNTKPERSDGDKRPDGENRSDGDKRPNGESKQDANDSDRSAKVNNGGNNGGNNVGNSADKNAEDGDGSNRRRRRRGRGRDRDDEQLPALDAIEATGYLDLRDDGYGFLRVNGYLQSAEDVYVPVKMARLYGLRKGDLVEGTARPANRNEKNPALQTITSVNGADPEVSPGRLRFEDLTAISPFERLRLEMDERPTASAARLVDLVAPIGKGQRGLIVAPPEAGSLELIKQLAAGIETNNPEAHLMVLLFDGRPEDVVEVRRSLEFGEVAAAAFDAAPEEQCALVDFTIERAKRMVEGGEDVVIIADGLTSIARAYSLGVQPTGRTINGVDAAALHPTKRFFGSARKLEEAGSLTILATIRVGTGAIFDEAIFEEFQGTATSEIHLDAWLADEGVFPNIDLELSMTRSADLLAEPDDLSAVDSLRALMATAIDEADGPAVDAARRLVERLESTASNEAFISEISSATSL